MELLNETTVSNNRIIDIHHDGYEENSNSKTKLSTARSFIEANTIQSTVQEIKDGHIIPVFHKDNEPVISHLDFIEATSRVIYDIYTQETILEPNIRLSHAVAGRIPEARNKPAKELLSHEKTLYYERMAFIIEIPSIYDEIDGSHLSLCVGGVKAYNLDNLSSRKGSDEHFKVFIGFKNRVCTNLCVSSDGFMADVRVSNVGMLVAHIRSLLEQYNANFHLHQLSMLTQSSLTEKQFAHLLGKCRMYNYLPVELKKDLPTLLLGDSQVNTICRDYFRDHSFCRDDRGDINLWKLYNLLTGANKSSYIDNFLERSSNCYHFVEKLRLALKDSTYNWFLN